MKRIIALTVALNLFVALAFSQDFGVYLTSADYLNRTPIKGTELKLTKSKGPSDLILTLSDGTKKEFKAGTFWGFMRSVGKKLKATTDYRVADGRIYAIFSSGAVYVYLRGYDGVDYVEFTYNKNEELIFVFSDRKYMRELSYGPDEPIVVIEVSGNVPILDPALITNDNTEFFSRGNLYNAIGRNLDENKAAVEQVRKLSKKLQVQIHELQLIDYYNNLKAGNATKAIPAVYPYSYQWSGSFPSPKL